MGPVSERERARDLERLITFVDAVVAIAITLLVLPLVDLASHVSSHSSVREVLHAHQSVLWSFLLSFAVIARLWFAQHATLGPVIRSHPRLDFLLVLWSLTIVFLPFPTALVSRAGDQDLTKVLYIGTMIVSTVTLGLINWLITRHPDLSDGSAPSSVVPALSNTALLVAALVLTLTLPSLSYLPMLLLFLDGPLRRLLARLGL